MIRSEVSVDDFKVKTELQFPCIKVVDPFPTFPLVFGNLEKGDMPVIVTFNGDTKEVGRISRSAYNVSMILKACGPFTICISNTNSFELTDIKQYVELFQDGFSD